MTEPMKPIQLRDNKKLRFKYSGFARTKHLTTEELESILEDVSQEQINDMIQTSARYGYELLIKPHDEGDGHVYFKAQLRGTNYSADEGLIMSTLGYSVSQALAYLVYRVAENPYGTWEKQERRGSFG